MALRMETQTSNYTKNPNVVKVGRFCNEITRRGSTPLPSETIVKTAEEKITTTNRIKRQ